MGIDILKDYKNKVSDVAIYARAGLDAISPREGGDVLKLKLLAEKYIDKRAREYEHKVSELKKQIKIKQSKKIKELGFKLKDLNEFLSDKINSISDLPPEIQDILNDDKLNPNDYSNVDIKVLKEYKLRESLKVKTAYPPSVLEAVSNLPFSTFVFDI